MSISASQVKELRQRTGVGMAKCKNALVEANGDIAVAIDLLRKQGMASAVKKESRETNEGTVSFKESASHIAIIKVNVETDFVVKNDTFQQFVEFLLDEALEKKPSSLESFLQCEVSGRKGTTIDQLRAENIQSLGENIVVSSVEVMEKNPNSSYGLYRHTNGKIVSIVELAGSTKVANEARSIAMHAAAADPQYLDPSDVPQSALDVEEKVVREQLKDKPDHLMDKIVPGRLKQFVEAVALTEQYYVMDPKKQVKDIVSTLAKEVGSALTVASFKRLQIGQ